MVQPAESLVSKDATRSFGTNPAARCSLPESEMRAVVVIVADVISEQPFQMMFIQRNDVIQQIATTALDPSLRHTVLPRTLERSSHRSDGHRPNRTRHLQTVLRVSVKDQEPGTRSVRKCFSQLLNDPHARWMPGDVDVQYASTIMADDEKAIEHAERDRWNCEEIHRSNGFPMVEQKRMPALSRLGTSRRSFHPTRDRSLGEIKTQHEKLAMDARSTSGWILNNHPEDQLPSLLRRLFSPNLRPDFGDQLPIKAEASSVPPHDRFRVHHDKGSFPSRPEPSHENPEEFVEYPKPWPGMPSLQDSELLPKNQVFKPQAATRAEEAKS